MSQCSQIHTHLKNNPLTSAQAFRQYGCLRLAARILDLRDKGVRIRTEMVNTGKKQYARYWLE